MQQAELSLLGLHFDSENGSSMFLWNIHEKRLGGSRAGLDIVEKQKKNLLLLLGIKTWLPSLQPITRPHL
jgi:hypothetical protein